MLEDAWQVEPHAGSDELVRMWRSSSVIPHVIDRHPSIELTSSIDA